MTPAKILVIDDEVAVLELISRSLRPAGYRVLEATDGADGLRLARLEKPDLILLDLMLPGVDGLSVCRSLKADAATRDIPVIMVTAKTTETDRIVGLEVGADDYVTKPFSLRELESRIRAVLRRARPAATRDLVRSGRLEFDRSARQVRVGRRAVTLTAREFDLLGIFVASPGRALARDLLLDQVWGVDRRARVTTRTVDVHVARLRRKLGTEGRRIETLRGYGYRWQDA